MLPIKYVIHFCYFQIYHLLPVTDLFGYNHDGHYLEEEREDSCLKLDPIFKNGVYYKPSTPNWDTDTYAILKVSISFGQIFQCLIFFFFFCIPGCKLKQITETNLAKHIYNIKE